MYVSQYEKSAESSPVSKTSSHSTNAKRQISLSSMFVSQLTRKSKGVEYATSEDDAVNWLKSHVSDWGAVAEEDREIAISIAQNKNRGVLNAKQLIEGVEFQKSVKKRREQRILVSQEDFNAYEDSFNDALADDVFSLMHSAYIAGNRNVTLGGSYSQDEVDQAIDAFEAYLVDGALTNNITNVHFFRRQNKAAAGKGRVGDTLATRGIQANFIATWYGNPINVHVDIEG